MGFWDDFRDGFRTGRGGGAEHNFNEPVPPQPGPPQPAPPRPAAPAPAACAACERKDAVLRRHEGELGECRSVIGDLSAEVEKLEAELAVLRRAERPVTQGGERYKKLRRVVLKYMHPDQAPTDKAVAVVLGDIFKELRAEIDKIEAA